MSEGHMFNQLWKKNASRIAYGRDSSFLAGNGATPHSKTQHKRPDPPSPIMPLLYLGGAAVAAWYFLKR